MLSTLSPISVHLAAISRRSEVDREQASARGTTLYSDWRNTLVNSNKVDAVISTTTPNLKVEIGRLCVLNNKPLAH